MSEKTAAIVFVIVCFLIGCVAGAGVCSVIMHNTHDMRFEDTHSAVLDIFDDTRAKIGSTVAYPCYQHEISPILSDARVKLDNIFTTGIPVAPTEPVVVA